MWVVVKRERKKDIVKKIGSECWNINYESELEPKKRWNIDGESELQTNKGSKMFVSCGRLIWNTLGESMNHRHRNKVTVFGHITKPYFQHILSFNLKHALISDSQYWIKNQCHKINLQFSANLGVLLFIVMIVYRIWVQAVWVTTSCACSCSE